MTTENWPFTNNWTFQINLEKREVSPNILRDPWGQMFFGQTDKKFNKSWQETLIKKIQSLILLNIPLPCTLFLLKGGVSSMPSCSRRLQGAELLDLRGKRITKVIAAEDFGKTGLAHPLHSSAAPRTQVNCARGLGTEDRTSASANVASGGQACFDLRVVRHRRRHHPPMPKAQPPCFSDARVQA